MADYVDVVRQSQREDVGLKAIDYGAGLFASTAVRLFDRHPVASFVVKVRLKSRVELLIKFAGRIVRDIQQGVSVTAGLAICGGVRITARATGGCQEER